MKTNLKRLFSLCLCLVMVFALTACGSKAPAPAPAADAPAAPANDAPAAPAEAPAEAPAGETIVLKVASMLPEVDNLSVIFGHAAEKIEELSGGTIKYDCYYNGTLLGFSEMFSGVADGIADIGLVGCGVMDSNTYLNQIFSMLHKGCPESIEETIDIYWQVTDEFPEIQGELADHNLIRIGLEPFAGHDTVIGSIKPLTTVNDFKGLTLQSSQAIAGDYFASMGSSSVNMELSEYYSALERGITEGVYDTWSSFTALKLREVSPYYTIFGNGGISSGIMNIVMNLGKYNTLTAEQQGWIRESIDYGITEALKDFYADREEAVAYAEEHSTINVVEGADLESFYEAMDPVIEAWFVKMEGQGFDTARDIYARISELFDASRG